MTGSGGVPFAFPSPLSRCRGGRMVGRCSVASGVCRPPERASAHCCGGGSLRGEGRFRGGMAGFSAKNCNFADDYGARRPGRNGGARVKRETGATPVQSRCCVSFLSCGPEQRELATVFSPMKGENAGRRSGEGRVRRPAVSCGTTGGMRPSRKGRCRKCEIHLFFLTELPKPGRMPGGSRHDGKIRPGYPF